MTPQQIDAMKLALEALQHEADTGNDDAYKLERDAIKEALAQPEPDLTKRDRESYQKGHNDGVAHHKQAVKAAQPEQGPKYRCCPHDSDCAVHNMPAYPAGPCDCTYKDTFNTPPSAEIYDVCLALATRELDRLIHCNFGQTPREAWADKVLNVYHFFDSNPKAKSLSDQYMLSPQRPWVELTEGAIKILWIQYRAALPRYLCFANAVLAKSKELNT